MARKQLRQVVDLYTTGDVVVLLDGSPVWVRALNPFEQDTARNEAQIAKARITLALKEHGSDEQAKVKMYFFEDGIDAARRKIVDSRVAEQMPKMLESLRNDPEWSERLDILDRGLDDTAVIPEGPEKELLEKIASDYNMEVGRRLVEEREFQIDKFDEAPEDYLWSEYLDWYIDRRASELMLAEYRHHQLLYGTYWCDAVKVDDIWDHSTCNGHTDRLFPSKADVHSAPEDLVALLMDGFDAIEMTAREAKNSRRQGSSSDSSPLPSEGAESTASTPAETRVALPGTSSSPSDTP